MQNESTILSLLQGQADARNTANAVITERHSYHSSFSNNTKHSKTLSSLNLAIKPEKKKKTKNNVQSAREEFKHIVASKYPKFKLAEMNKLKVDPGNRPGSVINKSWVYKDELRGLANAGVTCYINAALQGLFHIPAFHNFLVGVYKGHYPHLESPLAHFLAEVQYAICQRNKKLFIPTSIFKLLEHINPLMTDKTQEDCHEFFMCVLSALQNNTVPPGCSLKTSIIHTIFGGTLEQEIVCQNCEYVSTTHQDFLDLSVSFSEKTRRRFSERNEEARFRLEHAIEEHFQTEWITPDERNENGYKCPMCTQTTIATCTSKIVDPPEHLIISIKRFQFQNQTWCKTSDKMAYPMDLDMTAYAKDKSFPVCYRLTSLTGHGGGTLKCGHFITHCVQPNGQWGTYDDHRVRHETCESAASHEASCYILIYTRYTVLDSDTEEVALPVSIDPDATPQPIFPEYDSMGSRKWTQSDLKVGYVFAPHCKNPILATHRPELCCNAAPKAVRVRSINSICGISSRKSRASRRDKEESQTSSSSSSLDKKPEILPALTSPAISPAPVLPVLLPITPISNTPDSSSASSSKAAITSNQLDTTKSEGIVEIPPTHSTTIDPSQSIRKATFSLGDISPPTSEYNNLTAKTPESYSQGTQTSTELEVSEASGSSQVPEKVLEKKTSSRFFNLFRKNASARSLTRVPGKDEMRKKTSKSMSRIASVFSFSGRKKKKQDDLGVANEMEKMKLDKTENNDDTN